MFVFLIAIRNLFGEKGRLAITAGGVSFSVVLILVLLGLYQGWQVQMTRFLGNIPADIWIGQKGSRDMSHTVSILPSSLFEQIKNTEGVTKAVPFVGRQVSFELDGKEAHFFLVGSDEKDFIKPYKTVQGRATVDRGEIIIDKAFATPKKIKIGDTLDINKTKLKVVGFSSGGSLLVYSYAIADSADVRKIIDFTQFDNYYLVQTRDFDLAKSKLQEKFPDLEIMERQKFLENNTSLVSETFLPIIGVLVGIAFAIGIAVIGLTIFTATIEKSREYGVLKAIGYTNGQLFGVALIQSLIAGLLGFLAGVILVPIVVKIATLYTSSFIFEISPQKVAAILLASLAMSAIAALTPLKRLLSIDPAEVFKA